MLDVPMQPGPHLHAAGISEATTAAIRISRDAVRSMPSGPNICRTYMAVMAERGPAIHVSL